MDSENNYLKEIIRRLRKLPTWLLLIVVFTIVFSLIGIVFKINTFVITKISGKTETQLSLRNYDSKYFGFQIKLPYSWLPPAEEMDGIHSDPNLILQYIDSNSSQTSYEISRMKLSDGDLSEVLAWGKNKAMDIPDANINSTNQYDSKEYKGNLITYKIPKAGYLNIDRECHDWITYKEPYGYLISICSKPDDWGDLEKSFKEIIESFRIK